MKIYLLWEGTSPGRKLFSGAFICHNKAFTSRGRLGWGDWYEITEVELDLEIAKYFTPEKPKGLIQYKLDQKGDWVQHSGWYAEPRCPATDCKCKEWKDEGFGQ